MNERQVHLDLIFSSIIDNIVVSAPDANEQILKNSFHHSATVITLEDDMLVNKIDYPNTFRYDFKNADYNQINPNEAVPAISDNGFQVFEGASIMKYLSQVILRRIFCEEILAKKYLRRIFSEEKKS